VILKMHQDAKLLLGRKKTRQPVYAGEVIAALVQVLENFDYPCGQRLKRGIEVKLEKLWRTYEQEQRMENIGSFNITISFLNIARLYISQYQTPGIS